VINLTLHRNVPEDILAIYYGRKNCYVRQSNKDKFLDVSIARKKEKKFPMVLIWQDYQGNKSVFRCKDKRQMAKVIRDVILQKSGMDTKTYYFCEKSTMPDDIELITI